MSAKYWANSGRERVVLLVGDVFFLAGSLWVALLVSYLDPPPSRVVIQYVVPFSVLFGIWVVVHLVAGLYSKHTVQLKARLENVVVRAETANLVIAAFVFVTVPYFQFTSFIHLLIYLMLAFSSIYVWRLIVYPLLEPRQRKSGILIGQDPCSADLRYEINNNRRYGLFFEKWVNPKECSDKSLMNLLTQAIDHHKPQVIAADFSNPRVRRLVPGIRPLLEPNGLIVSSGELYEELFERIPIGDVHIDPSDSQIDVSDRRVFEVVKRAVDLCMASVLLIPSILLLPFVCLAIKLEDGGKLFHVQDRVGMRGEVFKLRKFRSMSETEAEKVTHVGRFLRKSRIDELPQLIAVFVGHMSFIGPRPELPALADEYVQHLPRYGLRHLVKPGLSGWAQVCQENPPKHGLDVGGTAVKLSYDLFYVKNRTLLLELRIALRTIKILLCRTGV